MNRRIVLQMVGQIVRLEGVLLCLPLIVSLLYTEWLTAASFGITAAIALAVGFAMVLISRPRTQALFAKDGFVIVAAAWVLLSLIGALPFVFSPMLGGNVGIPSYVDAVFETVSGLTTTGASILPDPAVLDHGLLFWRSFTHWIGGMGVLVLIMAIVPSASGRSIHIMRAEMPGPVVGKLVPRIRDTAKILYLLYIGFTLAEIILLVCGDMNLFESVVHAFGTAGTGGFGIRASSIGGYSAYSQWVIAVFMLLFGVNFNLYYLLLVRRFRQVVRSGELWFYLAIVGVAATVITLNIWPLYQNVAEVLRLSSFQTVSFLTTTGYGTANFNAWPGLSRAVLFVLMFLGGCAGSTAGGLKLSRVMLLIKTIRRDLRRMLHPRSVGVVQIEGKRVDDRTLHGVASYFALYMGIILITFLLLCFEPFALETNLTAAVSCFNNIGPFLSLTDDVSSFAAYAPFSKLVLSLAMLMGRLEIYPMLFLLTPSTWKKV